MEFQRKIDQLDWEPVVHENEAAPVIAFLEYILGQDPSARIAIDYVGNPKFATVSRHVSFRARCDARIRPFAHDLTIQCMDSGDHEAHYGEVLDMAYPGSQTQISWMEEDRRTFHGEWPGPCQISKYCTLPNKHNGECVTS